MMTSAWLGRKPTFVCEELQLEIWPAKMLVLVIFLVVIFTLLVPSRLN